MYSFVLLTFVRSVNGEEQPPSPETSTSTVDPSLGHHDFRHCRFGDFRGEDVTVYVQGISVREYDIAFNPSFLRMHSTATEIINLFQTAIIQSTNTSSRTHPTSPPGPPTGDDVY